MNCLVLGSSGATGQALLRQLCHEESFIKIVTLNRRFIQVDSDKIEQRIVNFKNLSAEDFSGKIDVAICCLGTTLAVSTKAEFEFVERGVIVLAAKFLLANGCKEFHLVTGYASDPNSMFFVPRIKGECEESVKKLGFSRLVIYRPGLLRCQRTETRYLESAARFVSNWIDRWNLWSISTDDLAKAIIKKAKLQSPEMDETGNEIVVLEHSQIVQMISEL